MRYRTLDLQILLFDALPLSIETLSNSFSMVIVFIASSTLSRIIRMVFLLLISIYISHNVNESPRGIEP